MKQINLERLTLAGVLVILVLLFWNSQIFSFRMDMTEEGIYTISPETLEILADAQEPLLITYYVSERIRSLSPIPDAIEDLLREYSARSRGRVRIQTRDPQAENLLEYMDQLGIPSHPIQIVEEGEQTLVQVYTGIQVEYLGREEVLPVVFQVETLEYELTSRINALIQNHRRTVGILIGDQSRSFQQEYQILSSSLSRNFVLRQIEPGENLGLDLDVVLVIGGWDLSTEDVAQLQEYQALGGRLFLALDTVRMDINTNQAFPGGSEKPLNQWVQSLGIQTPERLVQDRYSRMVQFQGPRGINITRYPLWIEIQGANVNLDHPVTSRFEGLDLLWASPLVLEPDNLPEGWSADVLLWTSQEAQTQAEPFNLDPTSLMYARSADPPGRQNLAYSLSGEGSRIMVLGDSDFASDLMRASGSQEYNVSFIENSIEWLTQEERLLRIKTRPYRVRNLVTLQDPDFRARAAFSLNLVNLILIPLIVLTAAWVRRWRRARQEERGSENGSPAKKTEGGQEK